jgi:hypothetical protein
MADFDPRLHAMVMEVVDSQIRELNPPETKQTFERLLEEGFTSLEARKLIGTVVVSEIFEVLQKREIFDQLRFVSALNQLPGKRNRKK